MCTVRASKWLAGPRNHNERDDRSYTRIWPEIYVLLRACRSGSWENISIREFRRTIDNRGLAEINELSRLPPSNRASSVMESPGRTTWVRVQTIAVLETSLSALTATKTFSERLSFLLYCGLPITISGKDYGRGQTNPGTSQVDTVGAAYPIERKKKPRADPDAYLGGAASLRVAKPSPSTVRDPDSYLSDR